MVATTPSSRARPRWPSPVEDGHQGRGIGQLLLEHLAQAGRERGVERFIAEVLPDNRSDDPHLQGRRLSRGQSLRRRRDGARVQHRSHRHGRGGDGAARAPRRVGLDRTLLPSTLGRGHRRQPPPDTIGRALVRHLVTGGFTGRVYVVNPSADAVSGMPAYKTVGDIPGEVDVAIVAVPADAVQDVVLDCAAKGVHGLVVISSGFAETGEEGRVRQRRLVGLSRSYGLRLIGPNALGVINTDPEVSLNASLSALMPPRGRAGFFCQSGALGSAIPEKVNNRGLGLSTFVSAGNRADVSGNDLLQYWLEDDATEVVLLYLESIGNPRKFSRIARRVSRRKPIIAVRSGRSTRGVPMGHAVRKIAAPGRAVDAMFRRAGVIRSTRWRRCSTSPSCWPTSRCRAVAGSPSWATPTPSGCSPPTPPPASGSWSTSRSPSVPTPVPRTSRTPSTPPSTTPRSTPWPRSTSPAQCLRRGRRQRARGRRRAVRQADRVDLPRCRGRAGAAARPRRRRLERRSRFGAVLPGRRGRGARAGACRGVRRLAAHPRDTGRRRGARGPAGGTAGGQRAAHAPPRGP
ncbi:GNAT family N-acetyltransferase [Nocardioides sp. B-3]|uniref:GNAT family N-acetyltransferase n=1 Tax=Nocardioides sp. B-3 TaxID=2895565 RepID=UPI002152D63C|nr:GNAT family N-acetyltransferase [Nocardioides sp. B-3]UUZ58912.1 GNAT family N-acetyltransferase [Nocardioides sp. B-3]